MLNLKHLKGKDPFKSISVTEDYTVLERKMIQSKETRVRAKRSRAQGFGIHFQATWDTKKRTTSKKIQER